MTPRSLFAIIIKIIGIYLVFEAMAFLPQLISTIYQYGRMMNESSQQDMLGTGFFLLLAVGTYLIILRYCLFKTDWLIDKLHLDRGFTEEKFEINIHRSTVLKIAVIVIGSLMIIDSLPLLCKQAFSYTQMNRFDIGVKQNPASPWLAYYFVKFCLGFSLVSTNRMVVNFIERKRKDPVKDIETIE
jgi:hypothetical protein